jgi:exosortase
MPESGSAESSNVHLLMTARTRVLLFVALLATVGLLLYRNVLYDLGASVLTREEGSHGVFIPFISAFIIWQRREKLSTMNPAGSLLPGLPIAALGFLLLMVRLESLQVAICSLSFLFVTAGLIVSFFGRQVMKELTFPLFFLAAMFPFPRGLYEVLTEWMRIATTWGSVSLLKVSGFPIYREGYYVSIPGLDLFIAEACSGIRYLIPYFVFGLAYAFLTRRNLISRSIVVIATVPLSILAGIMRQTSVFLSAHYIGHYMADHRPHVMISWAVFGVVLITAMWVDHRILERPISPLQMGTPSPPSSPCHQGP